MNRIAISLDAMARSQMATAMDRAQTKNEKADKQKTELYQKEEALDAELKEAKEGLDEDAHWTKKALGGITGFFGGNDFKAKKMNEFEKLTIEQKRVQTELSRVKGDQDRTMRSLGEAVNAAQDARATVSRTLEDDKAVAESRHNGATSIAGDDVAGGKGLRVEGAQAEMAAEMVSTATEGADRARTAETDTLQAAADHHQEALDKHSKKSFGLQMFRLWSTVSSVSQAVAAVMPRSPIGILTPMDAALLAGQALRAGVSALPAAAVVNGISRPGLNIVGSAKNKAKAESSELEVVAALDADMAQRADHRRQEGLRLADEARNTVSELRDHNRQVRV